MRHGEAMRVSSGKEGTKTSRTSGAQVRKGEAVRDAASLCGERDLT